MISNENGDLNEVPTKEEAEDENIAKDMILAEGYQQNSNLLNEEQNHMFRNHS